MGSRMGDDDDKGPDRAGKPPATGQLKIEPPFWKVMVKLGPGYTLTNAKRPGRPAEALQDFCKDTSDDQSSACPRGA